jgi:hypothetical protein
MPPVEEKISKTNLTYKVNWKKWSSIKNSIKKMFLLPRTALSSLFFIFLLPLYFQWNPWENFGSSTLAFYFLLWEHRDKRIHRLLICPAHLPYFGWVVMLPAAT